MSVPSTRIRSRAPAIWATAIALALLNLGVATVVVIATSGRSIFPLWIGLLFVGAGLATALGAVLLWRQYLVGLRQR